MDRRNHCNPLVNLSPPDQVLVHEFYQPNIQTAQFISEKRTSGVGQESKGATLWAPANHVTPRVLEFSQAGGGILSSSSGPGRKMLSTTVSAPDRTPRPPMLLNAPRSRLAPTTTIAAVFLQVCAASVIGYGSSQKAHEQNNNSSATEEAELSTQEVLERFKSI